MTTITSAQFARLEEITIRARDLWSQLAALEEQAYQITGEEDRQGFTSDLVLQSNVEVQTVLDELDIEVAS